MYEDTFFIIELIYIGQYNMSFFRSSTRKCNAVGDTTGKKPSNAVGDPQKKIAWPERRD
jgi:hypothetical protein